MGMAPSTRQQRNSVDTTSVATSTDTSTRSVSSKKKGKGTNTHPKLPPLVIRWPQNAGGESEVSFRKCALSPKEGPATDAEGLAKRPAVPSLTPEAPMKPAKRVKVGSLEGTHPPRLELLDDEVKPMSAGMGSVPPSSMRKLRRLETLVQEDGDEDRNSSLDNNLSHSSVTGSSGLDSEPVEGDSEEHEDMVAFTQTARSSQRLAFKRPSWLGGATDDGAETPQSAPGKRVRFKDPDLDNRDSEYAGTASKGRLVTHVHSTQSQNTVSGLTDTISEEFSKPKPIKQFGFGSNRVWIGLGPNFPNTSHTNLRVDKWHQLVLSAVKLSPQDSKAPPLRGDERSFHTPLGILTPHLQSLQALLPRVNEEQLRVLSALKSPPWDLRDSTRNGHAEVPRLWPADTDLSKTSVKLRLTDQSSIVRSTIMGSFNLLHASIVLENAFPETLQVARFIRDALSTASLRVWGAEHVHAHILKDSNYCWQMSVLPRAHISIFHAEVKERCVITVALLFSVYDPIAIVDLVKKLETDFCYIYPRRSKGNNDHVLVRSPDLRCPFRSSVIISVARDLYFSGNTPFVTVHQDQFPCHHGPNGDIIWEVPKAMVALVSTAVYECHIANLNRIEMERNTSYHKMMADIYQLVINGGLDQPPPSNSVPVLDLSMLED
ncbi:hypothetical protein EDB83DRAFT_2322513 [Lactarius deliciosus]|nr:hypothetical protein EDB83DRAFT_2322513 [Lactarius deliciosus]